MEFRKLQDGETRILWQRHLDHKDNEVPAEEYAFGKTIGEKLLPLKVEIAYSSPEPRAYTTALATMFGNGVNIVCRTDDRISAMRSEGEDATARIKAVAKEKGLKGDAGLAEVMFGNYGYEDMRVRRAKEGAEALIEMAIKHVGKTVLATSHGISRIELVVLALLGNPAGKPDRLVGRGDIVELIIDNTGLVELKYHEFSQPENKA